MGHRCLLGLYVLVTALMASQRSACQEMPSSPGPQTQPEASLTSQRATLAPAPVPGALSVTGSIFQEVKLAPYLERSNSSLTSPFVVLNNTYRFIDRDLTATTDAFKQAVSSAFNETVGSTEVNLDLQYYYYPSMAAPIIGPDATQAGNLAPAYSTVPDGGPLRKLLQAAQSDPVDDWKNFNRAYRSMDVRLVCWGSNDSSVLQITQPTQLNGYVEVKLAQAGIKATMLPLSMDFGNEIKPIVQTLPLNPIYVLGTILEGHGTGFFPVTVGMQNILLTALNQMLGSQQTFLYNQVVKVWQDSANYTIRVAFKTYLKTPLTYIDQIAGGSTAAFMDQLAHAIQANFSVIVLESQLLGTHLEEIAGDPKFDLDPTNRPIVIKPSSSSSSLSGGAIAGIAVGAAAAIALVIGIVVLLLWRRRRARQPSILDSNRPGQSYSKGGVDHLVKTLMSSGTESKDASPSLGTTKGGSAGGYSTSTTQTASAQQQHHPLNDAWSIHPSELAVCQGPDGKDWLLGVGSFGQVYRGLKGGIQDVAIKQLIKPDSMHLKMFEKEIALLRMLNFDRNIVQFYGACIAEGNLMLVMEYMEQGDLREALGQDSAGKLGWYGKGAQILIDIARGLHFLHSNKVVHRDLKTKNILLTKNYEAKIADVGLSKLMGSQLLSTQLDTAGTFSYAAPELLLGEPCNEAADIYSYAVILWELVTHEIPVRGALRAVRVPDECPLEVANIIEACLRRDPAARPTAKAIYDIFQDVLKREAAAISTGSTVNTVSTASETAAGPVVREVVTA